MLFHFSDRTVYLASEVALRGVMRDFQNDQQLSVSDLGSWRRKIERARPSVQEFVFAVHRDFDLDPLSRDEAGPAPVAHVPALVVAHVDLRLPFVGRPFVLRTQARRVEPVLVGQVGGQIRRGGVEQAVRFEAFHLRTHRIAALLDEGAEVVRREQESGVFAYVSEHVLALRESGERGFWR